MDKLYCPYCEPKYTLVKRDQSGNLFCGYCGEYLIKKNLITIKMIVSFISVFSIILPIILLLFFSIKDYRNDTREYYKVKIIELKKLNS